MYVRLQREGKVPETGGFSLIGSTILSLAKEDLEQASLCLVALFREAKLFLVNIYGSLALARMYEL